jgi:hypothetical protein
MVTKMQTIIAVHFSPFGKGDERGISLYKIPLSLPLLKGDEVT